MGGNAFLERGPKGNPALALKVPRMSPAVYAYMKAKHWEILERFFNKISVSAEGPGKTNHGDVDYLVAGQKLDDPWPQIAASFEATRWYYNGKTEKRTWYFGVKLPWDEMRNEITVPEDVDPDAHAQLDVYMCEETKFDWVNARNSHGDLWWILSQILHPFGFYLNDVGFLVEIAEIYPFNHKDATILLSSEPLDILRFAGLDIERYEEGFSTEEAAFRWLAQCRGCDASTIISPRDIPDSNKYSLERGMYCRFFDEFVPSLCANKADLQTQSVPQDLRDTFLHQALDHFDKRKVYETRIEPWRTKWQREAFGTAFSQLIPPGTKGDLKKAMNALKRWIIYEKDTSALQVTTVEQEIGELFEWAMQAMKFDYMTKQPGKGGMSEREIARWVRDHAEEAYKLEGARDRKRFLEEKEKQKARKAKKATEVAAEVRMKDNSVKDEG